MLGLDSNVVSAKSRDRAESILAGLDSPLTLRIAKVDWDFALLLMRTRHCLGGQDFLSNVIAVFVGPWNHADLSRAS